MAGLFLKFYILNQFLEFLEFFVVKKFTSKSMEMEANNPFGTSVEQVAPAPSRAAQPLGRFWALRRLRGGDRAWRRNVPSSARTPHRGRRRKQEEMATMHGCFEGAGGRRLGF